MISFLCFVLCAFLAITSMRRSSDLFSPARVFGLTWCFVLGLTELKLSNYQEDWTLTGWLLVLMGPAAFLLGTFVAYVFNLRRTLLDVQTMRVMLREEPVDRRALFTALCVGFSLYALSYSVSYAVKGFVPLFSALGSVSRVEFGVFGLGILVHSVPFSLFFIVLYHVAVNGEKTKKRFLKIVAVLMTITFLFLLQRFQLMMSLVICTTLLYYMTNRIRVRAVLVSFVAIAALFYLVSTLRAGELLQIYLHRTSRMKFGSDFMLLTEPYMYFVMNLENLARGAERLEIFTFGYYTFDFFLALGGVKHLIGGLFQPDPTPFLVSSYNTYTAMWTYYRDFGVFGMTAIPFFLGLSIGLTYYSMRAQPTIDKMAMYCIMVFVMVISFFNSPLSFLWFAYNLVAFYVILKVIRPRSSKGIGAKAHA